jgi:hypothetical protein
MKNRSVAILTLGSFLVFCWSCFSVQEIRPAVLASEKAGDYEIRKVEKTSGEIIEYSEESPGRVGQGHITGTGMLKYAVEIVEVDSAGLEIISRPGAPFINVKTRDGQTYGWIKEIDKRGDKSVLHILKVANEKTSTMISLFEVKKAWAKMVDGTRIFSAVLIFAVLIPVVSLLLVAATMHPISFGGGW